MERLELNIGTAVYGGMALARHDGVVFVKGAIPGERVIAEITERKRDYRVANAVEVLEQSSDRVAPPCKVYGACGGCQYLHISYERQVSLKKEILEETLTRIGRIDRKVETVLYGSPQRYRTKGQLKVSDTAGIGFYRENSIDVIQFDDCLLLSEGINSVVSALKSARLAKGFKEIEIYSGKNTIGRIVSNAVSKSLAEDIKGCGLDGVVTDGGIIIGDNVVEFERDGYRYTITPGGFYQTNWELNKGLIELLMSQVGDLTAKKVLDVYAGAGNFTIPLSRQAGYLVVIEENPISRTDFRRNMDLNGIKGIKFISSQFEKARISEGFDLMILNPPRRGLSGSAVEKVLTLGPKTIAYVSCNPSTFARDLSKLMQSYDVSSIHLIDMFPNTFHSESLGILSLR